MRRRHWLGLLLLLVLGPATWAAEPARIEVDRERRLVISRLPPILAMEEVQRHLTTGLTTTFLFRAEARNAELAGGARVDVRYELWDEVFHISVLGGDGLRRRHVAASMEELAGWWRTLRLVLADLGAARVAAPARVRVSLEVVPFSSSEGEDTRRWFTEAVSGRAGGDRKGVARSPEAREDTLEQMFSVLIATSIKGRAVTARHWTLDVSGGGSK